MGFEDLQQKITQGAEWTQTPKTRAFLGVTGKLKDLEYEKLRDGMNVAYVHRSPEDALEYLARDSVLPRAPGEALEPLRGRIDDRWETHRESGTEVSVKAALAVLGLTNVEIYEDWEGHFADGEWYSRFWVVAQPPFPFGRLVAPFVTPVTGGTTASIELVRRVKADILYWKASGGYPVEVIVWFGDGALGGINTIPPFVAGDATIVRWQLGKLAGIHTIPPFIAGGYAD